MTVGEDGKSSHGRYSDEAPKAHLIHGYLASGKTTFARQLEHSTGSVRFTPDEWMVRLFGEDPPAAIFDEKAAAILALMEPLWLRCLGAGADVVLDYGFWRRSERDNVRRLVRGIGAEPVLYELACDESEAIRRIALRNAGRRTLYTAPETFEFLKCRFEPLEPDEKVVAATR